MDGKSLCFLWPVLEKRNGTAISLSAGATHTNEKGETREDRPVGLDQESCKNFVNLRPRLK